MTHKIVEGAYEHVMALFVEIDKQLENNNFLN